MNGSVVGTYLYYDASIEYFGTKKHLPYAILAFGNHIHHLSYIASATVFNAVFSTVSWSL